MNPFVRLWQFSLAFLIAVVTIICLPASLMWSGTVWVVVLIARHRRNVRHDRYSWTDHQPHKQRKSGYRRARYGRWA